MRSLLMIMIAMCLAWPCANAGEKSKFKIEVLPISKDNACLSWAKAHISQRIKPLFEDYAEEETKCRMIRFTLDEAYPHTYYYVEIIDRDNFATGYLFENTAINNSFSERIKEKNVFVREMFFSDVARVSFDQKGGIDKEYSRLLRKGSFPLECDADLVELVGLLRERHKDKFLETSVSKEKFADVPAKFRKAVMERIRSHIVEHDLKSRKILEALGAPMPSELRVKIMPFAATNCDFYYMYDNTPKRTLRRVTSNADGGFSPLQETAAGDEAHNADLQWVDHPNTTGGPTLRDEEKVFFKSLEQDGVLITIRLPAREKN